MDELRVFEAFAGIGTQSLALKRLGVNYKVVGIAEIDVNAIISYASIRDVNLDEEVDMTYDDMYFDLEMKNIGYDFKKKKVILPRSKKELMRLYVADREINNYGDISLIDPDTLPDFDLFTYSFPCQDLSISGKQEGLKEGTRSGQLYECEKIIALKKPKYTLLENVKNLVGKKFKPDFDKWIEWLESQGYSNYWQVLNAKDYGIPQNRERVFAVSILDDWEGYEFPNRIPNSSTLEVIGGVGKKNLFGEYHQTNRVYDSTGLARTITANSGGLGGKSGLYKVYNDTYSFPEPFPLEVKLKDILEDEVDEKYYLTQHIQDRYQPREQHHANIAGTTKPHENSIGQQDIVYKTSGVMGALLATGYKHPKQIIEYPNLTTMQGGHRHPKIIDYVDGEIRVKEGTKIGYKVAEEGDSINISFPTSGTRRGRVGKQVSQTLTTSPQIATVKDFRIRRLTPLECWRLMGIDDECFYRAKGAGISDSQLYKQAGNAIVVNVLEEIFRNLLQ